MNYKEAVKFLEESLLYQMSLGSKELFHSNVWWWLIKNDKNFIKVFIPDFDPSIYKNGEYIWPRREEKHRDVLIWLKDCSGNKFHIVIENKIKTLPTIYQLEKYTTNLGKNLFLKGILTGIGQCSLDLSEIKGSNDVSANWAYVSYDEIAYRILEIATKSNSDIIKKHLEQIKEYCSILVCINLILDENIKKYSNVLTYKYDDEFLKVLRIGDIFKKHKGSQFLNYIKAHQKELEAIKPNGYNLIISQSFHNCKTTIDIRFSNWKNEKTPYNLLGVQIEDNQFRIVAEKNARLENITADNIYNDLANKWFDDSYDDSRFIFGNKTSMKPRNNKKYDTYNTSGYCFVYQYFDVDKIDNSYESLYQLIKKYMDKASKLLEEI